MITEKRNALQSLITSSGGVHLTAYLSRNSEEGGFRAQLALVLKNGAKNLMSVMTRSERSKFLKPVRTLLEDKNVLGTFRGNIGIFRTQDSFRVLHVPVEVEYTCMVATTFHVKPLLRWLQFERDFILVGIDRRAVHLYQGSQHSLRHIETLTLSSAVLGIPSIYEKLGIFRRRAPSKSTIGEISNWLQNQIENLCKGSRPKIFFAGRKSITEALKNELNFRNMNKTNLWPAFETKQLGRICSEIRSLISKDAEKYIERSFWEFQHANNLDLTDHNIFRIAHAAVNGRVRRLMIASDRNIFGKLNNRTGELKLHNADLDHEDDCLLDDLAQTVLQNGGKVLVASQDKVPGGHPVLAISDPVDPEMRLEKMTPKAFSLGLQVHGATL
jgi:hypothetical protein